MLPLGHAGVFTDVATSGSRSGTENFFFFFFSFCLIDSCPPPQLYLLHLLQWKVSLFYQRHKRANVEFNDIFFFLFFLPEVFVVDAHREAQTRTDSGWRQLAMMNGAYLALHCRSIKSFRQRRPLESVAHVWI